MARGEYEAARQTFARSQRYWPLSDTARARLGRIDEFIVQESVIAEGERRLAAGEWQACIDSLATISATHPKSSAVAASLTHCQAKLAERGSDATETPTTTAQTEPTTGAKQVASSATADSSAPNGSAPTEPAASTEPTPGSAPSNEAPAPPQCSSDANPTFTHHVTDLAQIDQVIAPPTTNGGHLKTHGYFFNTSTNAVPVYAPHDATLDTGVLYDDGNPGGVYGLTFKATCEVKFRFGHITDVIDEIAAVLNQTPNNNSYDVQPTGTVTVRAGQQIGSTTGTTVAHSWDFGAYNSTTSNRFADNPNWSSSWVYTTAVCPWTYYSGGMYAQVKALFGSTAGNPPEGESFCS